MGRLAQPRRKGGRFEAGRLLQPRTKTTKKKKAAMKKTTAKAKARCCLQAIEAGDQRLLTSRVLPLSTHMLDAGPGATANSSPSMVEGVAANMAAYTAANTTESTTQNRIESSGGPRRRLASR